MRFRIGLLVLVLGMASCTGAEGDTTTTAPPTAAPTSTAAAPSTTTTTTVAPSTNPPDTTVPATTAPPSNLAEFASGAGVTLSTSDQCAGLTDPVASGTVTWSDGERMWEGQVEGDIRCLFHVAGDVQSLTWAPQGDRLLVNSQLIVGGPSSGQVASPDVDWRFTYPSGLNLVGVADGRLLKWDTAAQTEIELDTLTTSEAVGYHPTGLHFAVAGVEQPAAADLDPTEGIFIAESSGADPVNLVLGFDVSFRDIAFANDGSILYFVAEHNDLIHFHSIETIPFEDEGVRRLGSGAEDFAITHATSSGDGRIEFSNLLVHPSRPDVAAWTTPPCPVDDRRGFQVISGATASLVQGIGPASAIGLLGEDPTTVVVATIAGPCDAPRELAIMTASIETGEVNTVPLAGNVTAAAVRSVAAPAIYDLVDVEIVGFA